MVIKFIGVMVLGVCLMGLTSGCGKKLVRGSTGSDQRVVRASLKALPSGQQTSTAGNLAGIDQVHVGQEFDLKAGQEAFESGGESGGPFGSSRTAMLTTPASSSSSSLDSPYSSSAEQGSNFASSKHDFSRSSFGKDGQKQNSLSSRDAKRNGVTFSKGLHDIYFQYDSWRLTEESRQNLEANAEWLKANPHERITIEGHCDERGTQAYNYVLGEKRATMVQQYLGFLGVPQHQLIVTSFGKDKPKCHTFSEKCFQKNRRAHFGSDLNLASQ